MKRPLCRMLLYAAFFITFEAFIFAGSNAFAQDDSIADDSSAMTAPATGDFTGNWTGDFHDSVDGDGTVEIIITSDMSRDVPTKGKKKKHVKGVWTPFAGRFAGGDVSGTSAGNDSKLKLTNPPSKCTLKAMAMLVSSNEMKGVYRTSKCPKSSSGTWDVTK